MRLMIGQKSDIDVVIAEAITQIAQAPRRRSSIFLQAMVITRIVRIGAMKMGFHAEKMLPAEGPDFSGVDERRPYFLLWFF